MKGTVKAETDQFSPGDRLSRRGDMRKDSAEIFFQSFLQEALGSSSDLQRCPLFDIIHLAFPLRTTASPTLQGALKDGFREAVVACDIPEPWKLMRKRQ